MKFLHLNAWLSNLHQCLRIDTNIHSENEYDDYVKRTKRYIEDTVWGLLISHVIPSDELFELFRQEIEENVTTDHRADKYAELLRIKSDELRRDLTRFVSIAGLLLDVPTQLLYQKCADVPFWAYDDADRGESYTTVDYVCCAVSACLQTLTVIDDYLSVYGSQPTTPQQEPPQPEPPQPEPGVKLRWNANKRVLYDLFAQLTLTNTYSGKPLIDNSLKDIALFLAQSIEGFPKASTIERELEKMREIEGIEKVKRGRIDLNIYRE
ncbi:hypothetical protein F5984_11615 [Rudanella paleaurantiibacter]|uniref:Uncharacterized protein n=1 Tax=Rudanella paleaurantiibacter TaxID=2614655 RepID=A0A7J5U1B5_9BACT|nr:hypothetical protein [Rudanella paleaurantiibacter]KAB7731430.1 hypothetical protein F5984_11615 [Rudanella paleaurantiibacter]